jgi:ABC-type Fe3+-hydroxamate transport system substrate-binding protein
VRLALALLVVVLALAPPAAAVVVRDMLGRDVTLDAPPTRIVSLVPSVTESVYALGGQARLIGRTDWCDYPAAAKEKPSVGGMINPSIEMIVALKPDLVIATDEGNREETFVQLRRLGIATYLVHAHRVDQMLDMVTRVAALLERREAAVPIVASIRERIDAIRTRVAPLPTPRVLYVLWPEPLIVPGRASHLTELIEMAGGRSITAAEGDSYVRFSLEAAVARAPEVIVLADHSASGTAAGRQSPEKWHRLTSVPAIKAGRLHSIDLSILHRYGPRVADGLELLARIIHPEAFR